jgi:hypothetical protein
VLGEQTRQKRSFAGGVRQDDRGVVLLRVEQNVAGVSAGCAAMKIDRGIQDEVPSQRNSDTRIGVGAKYVRLVDGRCQSGKPFRMQLGFQVGEQIAGRGADRGRSFQRSQVPAANRRAPSRSTQLKRWVFQAAKIALILLMCYAPVRYIPYAINADPHSSSAGLVIQILVWGMPFALRWSLRDQRRRCPVCLRLLGNPVRVGEPAGYFLEWNCTEMMCLRGHGMLYVPACHTSWFDTPRWFYMDSC